MHTITRRVKSVLALLLFLGGATPFGADAHRAFADDPACGMVEGREPASRHFDVPSHVAATRHCTICHLTQAVRHANLSAVPVAMAVMRPADLAPPTPAPLVESDSSRTCPSRAPPGVA